MQIQVINVQHPILSNYVQSFLFFIASDKEELSYRTFPNTNLCLAIYSNNNITYIRDERQNLCEITLGQSFYKSRLYGFHSQPFNAKIKSSLDQICILFHPGALRAFTNTPYKELLACDYAFDLIFSYGNRAWLERIFSETSNNIRARLLENFLLSQLAPVNLNPSLLMALETMNGSMADILKIDDISRKCKVNPSTLYRLFLSDIGQSPKSFFQTIRFRKVLQHVLLKQKTSLTEVAYSSSFYDQPHFNKEIKRLSGYNPVKLRTIVRLEQQQFAWVPR